MFWAFAGTAAVAVGVLIWSEWRTSPVRYISKPIASLAFIAAGIDRGALDSTYGTILFVGLILAAFGDVFLLGSTRRSFLAGLISFLLGHVAYVVAFLTLGTDILWLAGGFFLVVGLATVILRWLRPHLDAEMNSPVLAYVAVISLMVVAATGAVGDGATSWILAGAIGFFASDLAVARNQFVTESVANRAWGLPLYYASQFVLAWTVGV